MLDAGHKMPAGLLARPREIFFKKCVGGIDNRPAFVLRAGQTCPMLSKIEQEYFK